MKGVGEKICETRPNATLHIVINTQTLEYKCGWEHVPYKNSDSHLTGHMTVRTKFLLVSFS